MSEYAYTDTTQRQRLPRAEIGGCTLVQDLIPLYLDNEVSPESHALMADHLQHCERCSGYLAGARSVRSQILNEQQTIRAANATNPTVAQVRQPMASSLGIALWQTLMMVIYVASLFSVFMGFAERAQAIVLIGGLATIGAITGLLVVDTARTLAWRMVMALTGAAGLWLVPYTLMTDGPRAAWMTLFGIGLIVLGGWGIWLHRTQRGVPLTQPLSAQLGANGALVSAIVGTLAGIVCGLAAILGLWLVIATPPPDPDKVLGIFFALGGTIGLLLLNQRMKWHWRRVQPTMTRRLIGLVLIGGDILFSTVLMPLIYLGSRHPLLALAGGLALTIVGFVLARSDRLGPPRS